MRSYLLFFMISWLYGLVSFSANAGLIRDAEIEHSLRTLAEPIFEAAGQNPEAVNLFIVNDKSFNAFVAGGSNIFIHSGLLLAADTPEMLLGVLAHEAGHIEGGHLVRGMEQLERAGIGTIVSYVLGAVAAAAGAGDLGAALIAGGNSAFQQGFFAYRRDDERAADQAALRYLAKHQINPEGLLEVFSLLRREEKLHFGKQVPYAMTHPLSRERINVVRDNIERNPSNYSELPISLQQAYQRSLGKLEGFLQNPTTTFNRYEPSDPSLRARYARAVAYFKRAELNEALRIMDGLLKEFPNDPYLLDSKGQFLFESQRIREASNIYRQAKTLAPEEALIQTSYAQTLLALEDRTKLDEAIRTLEYAVRLDESYSLAWRLLAGAYGKTNQEGMKSLALAEKALLENNLDGAIRLSQDALDTLSRNTPPYRRAEDIHLLSKQQKKQNKKK